MGVKSGDVGPVTAVAWRPLLTIADAAGAAVTIAVAVAVVVAIAPFHDWSCSQWNCSV